VMNGACIANPPAACCGNQDCKSGFQCVSNACKCSSPKVLCGDTCAECCNDFDCAGNQRCSNGSCTALGCNACQTANNHACQNKPDGTACGLTMVCISDQRNNIVCTPCGSDGQACCTNSACDTTTACLVPTGGGPQQCLPCGGNLERCCPGASPCRDGRTCTTGTGGPSYCTF
jgi:hypothetical protein